jgi:sialic acid synthase
MTYIIGEIGQNHNGSLDICKLLIDVAARPVNDKLFGKTLQPMDAVKLTKRDLSNELSTSQMNNRYDSPHSFGKTYGEHRAFLELTDEEHFEAYKYTKKKGLDFIETFCAIGCLSLLKLFTPDKLKVASRDLTNLPLLSVMAETKIPIILSTGMSGEKELNLALNIISKYNNNISILHCVSEYPTQYENVNLNTITYLKKKYPEYTIGYSDHTVGISTPIAAVALGSKIIEKHISLDREMKGTDQKGSLSIDGIYRMVRDIRNLDVSMGKEKISIASSVKNARIKLERSIATKKELTSGTVISEKDIHLLSPGDGVQWSDRSKILGKKIKKNVPKNEIIYLKNIE